MRSVKAELLVAGLAVVFPGVGMAASVDFESPSVDGFIGSSMNLPGAKLTAGGGNFYVDPSGLPGFGVNSLSSHSSGHVDANGNFAEVNPANLSSFRIDFGPQQASSFSVAFNDSCGTVECGDTDTGYLEAFGAGGVSLGHISDILDGISAKTLSLSFEGISYVMFYSTAVCSEWESSTHFEDCTESDLKNSVYWDNISYELISEVPLPGTLGLLGIGLAGLGLLRRKPS